jgi:hypothetical protein
MLYRVKFLILFCKKDWVNIKQNLPCVVVVHSSSTSSASVSVVIFVVVAAMFVVVIVGIGWVCAVIG